MIQGLAWTPHGGDVLFIEVAVTPGQGNLTLTGSLGDVMTESCRIALGFLRSHCERFELDMPTLDKTDFHVHFPAGAIPKDGPSAGIAIASAMVSALRGEQVAPEVAMTGELTLMGEVLAIGGVREKVIAAQRLGIRQVILPSENRRDVTELKGDVIKGVRFCYVDVFAQVFDHLFRPRRKPRTRSRG